MKKTEKEIVNPFLFAHSENAETEEGNRLTHDIMYEILLKDFLQNLLSDSNVYVRPGSV